MKSNEIATAYSPDRSQAWMGIWSYCEHITVDWVKAAMILEVWSPGKG